MATRVNDITGKTLGKYSVIRADGRRSDGSVLWLAKCLCGTDVRDSSCNLKRGAEKPCRHLIRMEGRRFGRWTVLEMAGRDKFKNTLWKCKCDCGAIHVKQGSSLRYGNSKSCGCSGHSQATHMMTNTRLYSIWGSMRDRCYREKHVAYKNYGGRGIKVLWESFEAFAADMKESYDQHAKQYGEKQTTIDRVDNNGDYCKENCRWVTYQENLKNTRRAVKVEFEGQVYNVTELAKKLGVSVRKLHRLSKDGRLWNSSLK